MFPIGSKRRRLLNQSTHSRVANSTASKLRQGPPRWITSVLNKPMTVSARALMLLCRSSSFRCWLPRLAKMGEDLPCDIALEAAHDLRLRLSFCGATADIVDSGLVAAHPCNDDPVEGSVGLAMASAVQPVAAGLAAGGRYRAGTAHFG